MKFIDSVRYRGNAIFCCKIKRLLTFMLLGTLIYFVDLFFVRNRLSMANIANLMIPSYILRRVPYGIVSLCFYCFLDTLFGEFFSL